MNLSAWWSAWKYVAILAGLLCLSVGWNLHQWKHAGVIKEAARADAFKDALTVSAGMNKGFQQDASKLLGIVQGIKDQAVQRTIIYRQAAATPLPAQCAPGKARMDAVNSGVK